MNITKAQLVVLLDGVTGVRFDPLDPWGPNPGSDDGPNPFPWWFSVMRDRIGRDAYFRHVFGGGRGFGDPNPQPNFSYSAFLARSVINQAVAQYRFAEVAVNAEQLKKTSAAIGAQTREFVDDWCGTRPPKWPFPWSSNFDPAKLRPMDLLVAGAQFQKAADFQNPLQADFSAAAEQLFEVGLKRMGNS